LAAEYYKGPCARETTNGTEMGGTASTSKLHIKKRRGKGTNNLAISDRRDYKDWTSHLKTREAEQGK